MLSQLFRDLLVETTVHAIPNWQDCRTHVNGVRNGTWERVVPIERPYRASFIAIVNDAEINSWLRDLVQSLVERFAVRLEFARVLAEIDQAATPRTVANPFDEVLLEADRPFVNRRPLRNQLLDLMNDAGSAVLLIDGKEQTGKTYSYYLINHVAPKLGYIVNKFKMTALPKPDELAADILGRLGADRPLLSQGPESVERWAEKLADTVARAIVEQKSKRLFLFDEFSDTPLPDGTESLIIRLATYADEELRPYLRVVAMRFRAALPSDLDDVALRDDAQPFTTTDMVSVIMQVANARNWDVTEQVVQVRIQDFHAIPRTLKERFKFLRGMLQELAAPR
ncbi:hypothetical protein [Cupriavidus sp. L7L]|uniref:hypothetical protein n=1 Tax=Cupriavidus sp. L7L TaxID=2546443 RepID=UPI00105461F0|nr:hypothetical protein [Cupriavidus sp. L7L]TDF56778.1 hypothetical protein E1J61_36000 [Cupriavidus sp. L7L]